MGFFGVKMPFNVPINSTGTLTVFRVARALTVADVRPLLGNLSRSNYYEVRFGGLTSALQFYLSSKGVDSVFVNNNVGLMCYQAQLPGSSLATVESNNYHGNVENFAHTKIYTPLQLSFYCDNNYKSLKFIEHWMEYCNGGLSGNRINSTAYTSRLNYPNDTTSGYKAQSVSIQKFENNLERIMTYRFIGLFPKSLSSTQVEYGPNSELTRINCTFSYDRYVMEGNVRYSEAPSQLTRLVDDLQNPLSAITRLIN